MRLEISVEGTAEIRAPDDPLIGPEEIRVTKSTVYLDAPVSISSDGPVSVEISEQEWSARSNIRD